jgi:hypothetical protein
MRLCCKVGCGGVCWVEAGGWVAVVMGGLEGRIGKVVGMVKWWWGDMCGKIEVVCRANQAF